MITAYIALGSNLNHPAQQLLKALQALQQLPDTQLLACSSWYQNPAIGPGKQPDYLNGVVKIETRLNPNDLLAELQNIELQQGRVRSERWGARPLDLDIVLYGDLVLDTEELTIPHPRMWERNFVLVPLAEIAPELRFADGSLIQQHVARIGSADLKRIQHENQA